MFNYSKILIIILILNITVGQESARELSLGGSMVTISRGVSSVGVNPANLAYSRPSFNIVNFNTSLYNNLLSLEIYNNLNGADLENPNSPITKSDIFEILDGNSFKLNHNLNLNIPGINYSNSKYSISTRLRQNLEIDIGNGLFKTLFYGNEWETEIPLEMKMNSQTVLEYGLSSWFELEGISIGYTFKYLQGVSLIKVFTEKDSDPLFTDSTGIDMQMLIGREIFPGGSGYGIDLGLLTEESYNGWSVGLSVTNLFGYINWDKHNLNYSLLGKPISEGIGIKAFETEVIGFEITNLNASDLMSGSTELSDSLMSDTTYTQKLDSPILKTDYPSIFRLGLSKNFYDNYYLAYESRTGFQNAGLISSNWVHSIGVEIIRWKFTPIRFGLTSGDLNNHKFSFGSGLHFNPIQIDFGVSWMGSRKIYTANGLEFGFTVTLLR